MGSVVKPRKSLFLATWLSGKSDVEHMGSGTMCNSANHNYSPSKDKRFMLVVVYPGIWSAKNLGGNKFVEGNTEKRSPYYTRAVVRHP